MFAPLAFDAALWQGHQVLARAEAVDAAVSYVALAQVMMRQHVLDKCLSRWWSGSKVILSLVVVVGRARPAQLVIMDEPAAVRFYDACG